MSRLGVSVLLLLVERLEGQLLRVRAEVGARQVEAVGILRRLVLRVAPLVPVLGVTGHVCKFENTLVF